MLSGRGIRKVFPLGVAPSIPKFPVRDQNLGQNSAPGHQDGSQALNLFLGSFYLTASEEFAGTD